MVAITGQVPTDLLGTLYFRDRCVGHHHARGETQCIGPDVKNPDYSRRRFGSPEKAVRDWSSPTSRDTSIGSDGGMGVLGSRILPRPTELPQHARNLLRGVSRPRA